MVEAVQDWRYERKFMVQNLGIDELENIILKNRGFFKQLYPDRKINNIYFDTVNFTYFYLNVDGESSRKKLRIRWYGNTFGEIENPVLEVKIKEGLVGAKKRYRLSGFRLKQSLDHTLFANMFRASNLPGDLNILLSEVQPTLLNSYIRKYFISSDGKYRLTLDFYLTFYKIDNIRNVILSRREQNYLVIEIKYDSIYNDGIDVITNDFPFMLTKSSKYVRGIEVTQL